jgi:hypothetical protein
LSRSINQSDVKDAALPNSTIPDPGCLPAWDVDEMPEPAPLKARNLLALIGPGLVLAGGSIGTGEWVMGPKTAAQYQGALMWIVIVSIAAQIVLNTEVMRYTLCTGEPIMTGFMRTKPGPKFWSGVYLLLDVGSWWPAQAGLAAQIIVVALHRLTPADTIDENAVRQWSYAVFIFCGFLPLFGGKIYNTLQVVMGTKFLATLVFMVIVNVFYVSAATWGQIWGGLFDFSRLPLDAQGNPSIDWGLIAALAGYSGVGGLGNIMASNFVREKGWGMGGKVGAIPSAIGGQDIQLSHIGTACTGGPETRRRFKGWFRYLIIDQYIVWAAGSLIAMMLPCTLGAQYLGTTDLKGDNWKWAAAMAQGFGAVHGELFRNLTLLMGLIIMIPGQFYAVDVASRRWTDVLWSSSRRVRLMDKHHVKFIYYGFAGVFILFGISAFTFFPNLSATSMMIIAGSMANLAISASIFHTLYVNLRFLPADLRPSRLKQGALVLSGLFFLVMFGLVVNQKIVPLIFGK